MSQKSMVPSNANPRFVACDISKHSVMVAAVDCHQQILLPPRKFNLAKFEQWVAEYLQPTDKVVLEATGDAWYYYDLLQPKVAKVVVANPYKIRLIAQSKVKTDAKDATILARLLAADLIPGVWVPPKEVRQLRAVVQQRKRLIVQRTQARNRLHALPATYHIFPPEGLLFSKHNLGWWESLDLPPTVKLLINQQLSLLESLAPLLKALEEELARQGVSARWHRQSRCLIQLPGISLLNGIIILSAIGDISRFASAKELVGYAGLGAGIYASGETSRGKRITKQGRTELRTVMVEAAWTAVKQNGHWKELFERLTVRLNKAKAIVAIARKLLVVVWHVLTKEEADLKAKPEQVAKKMYRWALKLGEAGRAGLSGAEFVRKELDSLGLGKELDHFLWVGRAIPLPPSSLGVAS